jgi:hypothetical protein
MQWMDPVSGFTVVRAWLVVALELGLIWTVLRLVMFGRLATFSCLVQRLGGKATARLQRHTGE